MSLIVVTGAGGYVGTTLVPLLIDAGYTVRAIDRFFFGAELLALHPRLERIREDIRRLSPAHFQGAAGVIDLAAISNDPSGAQFEQATWQTNRDARVRNAVLAKGAGVRRYILPSSCSIYGFHDPRTVVDEASPPNPLTVYARANLEAEDGVRPLADGRFCVVILRQATLFGLSPRMRFDLAINGMTYGAWKTGNLPLLRDGTQWRPMLHVRDAARAMLMMLEAPADHVSGQIFNVGGEAANFQLRPLADRVAAAVPRDVAIQFYGEADTRSYRVSFARIAAAGFLPEVPVEEAVGEICAALEEGTVDRTPDTLTLEWYTRLTRWHRLIREVELHDGILDLSPQPAGVPGA